MVETPFCCFDSGSGVYVRESERSDGRPVGEEVEVEQAKIGEVKGGKNRASSEAGSRFGAFVCACSRRIGVVVYRHAGCRAVGRHCRLVCLRGPEQLLNGYGVCCCQQTIIIVFFKSSCFKQGAPCDQQSSNVSVVLQRYAGLWWKHGLVISLILQAGSARASCQHDVNRATAERGKRSAVSESGQRPAAAFLPQKSTRDKQFVWLAYIQHTYTHTYIHFVSFVWTLSSVCIVLPSKQLVARILIYRCHTSSPRTTSHSKLPTLLTQQKQQPPWPSKKPKKQTPQRHPPLASSPLAQQRMPTGLPRPVCPNHSSNNSSKESH